MNNTALSPSSFLLPPSPTFSVIIPVYNVAPYLRACLDSVLAAVKEVEAAREEGEKVGGQWNGKQPVVEIICVDDGSTDGSGEILDEYREKVGKVGGQRMVVLHQKNAGVSAARNAALTVAQGDWVIFVDADDLLCATALRDLAGVIARHPDDALVGFDKYEFEAEPPHGDERVKAVERCVDLSEEIPDLMALLALYQFAFRKDLLRGLFFKPYIVGEDLLFLCEVFSRAQRCWYMDCKEYAYRHRAGSVMRTASEAVRSRRICDLLGYLPDMFAVLKASGKRISRAFAHVRGNAWIEGVPYAISGLTNRREFFLRWLQTLELAPSMPFFSGWQKLVVGLNCRIRWWPVAYLTCVMPHQLKLRRMAR